VNELQGDTVARGLLGAARALAGRPNRETQGLWPRASALLARQALEVALKTYWSYVAPGTEEASMRAQLLCLEGYLPGAIAREAHQAWTALSRASHHHSYELAPTREELLAWCSSVDAVVDATERAWLS
jgi:hypothetical protein